MRVCVAVISLLLAAGAAAAADLQDEIQFEKHTIDLGAAETCAVADVNDDGSLDIIAGNYWFEGPAWERHKFRELGFNGDYLDSMSDLAVDVNGDGHVDVVTPTWFARKVGWYENPGDGAGMWVEHTSDEGGPIEFAILADLDNDGRAMEVLPQFGGRSGPTAWYAIDAGELVRHDVMSDPVGGGIGSGDVNGDGRTDILSSRGWVEAPEDPGTGEWQFHTDFEQFEFPDLGFLHVLDINGDGRNDVIAPLGHNYGIYWLEQGADGSWTQRTIDRSWSQAHASTLADLNGDGQLDLITGKRFHAHNGMDAGGHDPLGVYWYEFRDMPDNPAIRPRPGGTTIVWKRHVLDYGSRTGGGLQIPVVDIDADGDLDIVTPGKGGLFLFENLTN